MDVLRAVLLAFVTHLPGPTGERIRRRYWKRRLKQLGDDVRIDVGVHFVQPQHISIADGCWIDRNAIILAGPGRRGQRRYRWETNPNFAEPEGEVSIGHSCHI